MTPQSICAQPDVLADRLHALRIALGLLLGDEFAPSLAFARTRIVRRMAELCTTNPFRAALDPALCLDPRDDSAPLFLLVAALDLVERGP